MKKLNEILIAIIFYVIISYVLKMPNFYYNLIITLISTQIKTILPENYKNTLLLYTIVFPIICFYPQIALDIIIAITATIFTSLLYKKGCKLLYPIKNTTFTGFKKYIEKNTKKEYMITTFLLVLTVLTLILANNGEQIINTLNENEKITNYLHNDNTTTNHVYDNNYVQYVNIDTKNCKDLNITTTQENNTTTTIIRNYTNYTK